jgi:3-oxoacyl-[acyl-carrier protein] reductase
MDLGIAGNAALATASSSGLGKASATALAREGANVVVNGRDEDRLAAAVEEVDAAGDGDVVGVRGDLTVAEDMVELVDRTVGAFGTVDHVVTSAGGPPYGEFTDQSDEDWYEAFDMLVMGVVRLLREAEPHLRDGTGTIVNITSITVKEAVDSLVLSNSVRMSVIGLEKTLSKEFAPEVRVNAILPGYFETQRFQDGLEYDVEQGEYDSYEEGLEDMASGVPLDRVGDPIELGELAAFLSSERASYLTGVGVPIDGGVTESNL